MPGIRADRVLSLCLFGPLRSLGLSRGKDRVPILMYHSISEGKEEGVAPYYRTSTSPAVFANHMALLKEAGYQAVGLEKAVEKFRKPGLDSRNMAVITFDDGFRDFHSSAVPLLVKHNFSATMFLPTAFISRESRRFKDRDCLTWEEVRECRRAGMEFGSHTVNHPWLYEMSVAAIRTELEVSKAQIESQLGERVSTFAYPYAFPSADRGFVEAFVAALRDAGYESSVTTRIGRVAPQDDPFTLRRLPANTEDDKAFFLAKLRGDYDWMSWPQEAFKRFKRAAAGGRSPKSRLQAEQSSVAGK